MFSTDPRSHWERLARQDPYFAVLTDVRYRGLTLRPETEGEFFASGGSHVERILGLADVTAREFDSVLDFGCGVGRVTQAMAKISRRAVGVDVSPTMLKRAADHAEKSGITNIEWQLSRDFVAACEAFDLVHSFLVFQHMRPREGLALLRTLAARVRPGGVFAIHVTYWRPGGMVRTLLRRARSVIPGVNQIANLMEGKAAGCPYMQMNMYDMNEVTRAMEDAGLLDLRLVWERQGDVRGVIVIARRPGGEDLASPPERR